MLPQSQVYQRNGTGHVVPPWGPVLILIYTAAHLILRTRQVTARFSANFAGRNQTKKPQNPGQVIGPASGSTRDVHGGHRYSPQLAAAPSRGVLPSLYPALAREL